MTDNTNDQSDELLERETEPGLTIDEKAIIALSLLSGAMLAVALPNIITDGGAAGNLKIAIATTAATIVSYAVVRSAVKVGAPLAARKYRLAAAASVIALASVGAGFAGASLTGLTLPDVAERQMQKHGTALASYMGQQNELALEAANVGATVGFVAGDLKQWETCEARSNCLSKAAAPGKGSITQILREKAGDAILIGDEFERGDETRVEALAEMNVHYATYQKTRGKTDISIWDRRVELELIDNKVKQSAAKLANALPLNLVSQLGKDLNTGIKIPGRSDVERRVNQVLKDNGKKLTGILKELKKSNIEQPVFPEKPGVWTALTFIDKHLPLAGLVTVIDLIFPMMLFVMTYLGCRWDIDQEKHRRKNEKRNKPNGGNLTRFRRRPKNGKPRGNGGGE